MTKRTSQTVLAALTAALLVACSHGSRKKALRAGDADQTLAAASEKYSSFGSRDVETEEASLRGKDFSAVPTIQPVHFDYDKTELGPDARETLKRNAAVVEKLAGAELLLEGHADERGTEEYNLSLGQRRAKAVRDFYSKLGVDPKKVSTISYGKEKPVCKADDSDECHRKNRRAETLLKRS